MLWKVWCFLFALSSNFLGIIWRSCVGSVHQDCSAVYSSPGSEKLLGYRLGMQVWDTEFGMQGLGEGFLIKVLDAGIGTLSLGCRVWEAGFLIKVFEASFGMQVLGCRFGMQICDAGFRMQILGCRV